MTTQRVIDAFVRGDLDRRGFITRLTALGVSASAASAYALTLGRQSAAAAPGSPATGIARYQDGAPEEDYGTAIDLESDEEGVQIVTDAVNAVLSVLGALESFSADDFADPADFELLSTILEQQQEHADALAALPGGGAATPPEAGTYDSVDEFLADLAAALDDLVSTYAAVVPAIEDGETRQTLMNIALVAGRHAALVNQLAGLDPIPSAFEEPAVP